MFYAGKHIHDMCFTELDALLHSLKLTVPCCFPNSAKVRIIEAEFKMLYPTMED